MEKTILAVGIENEFEGTATLYFDLKEPQVLADYLKDNIELGDKKTIYLEKFTPEEFAELE